MFFFKKKKKFAGSDAAEKETSAWSGLYRFSKAEIEKAIDYSSGGFLGAGSAGQVYQGALPSGQLVAIKHIYTTATNNSFTREVEGLSRVRHHNLVSLLGYCDENGDKFLVYELCSIGNLAQTLSKPSRSKAYIYTVLTAMRMHGGALTWFSCMQEERLLFHGENGLRY